MIKRRIIIGSYDTAANGWTLSKWQLSAAEQKTNYVAKSGGDGSWDLSTALTDGIPKYNNRTLSATLECSEGTRVTREAKIREMINELDGLRFNITLPDDDTHHISGRVHVARGYSDLAHASVTVTANCEPWLYSNDESVRTFTAANAGKIYTLINNGRRAVVPTLTVSGEGAMVALIYDQQNTALGPGTHQWPTLLLTPGEHDITVAGGGVLTVRYREAVLE